MNQNLALSGASVAVTFTVTNPSTNVYAITAVNIIAPSGWSFTGAVVACPAQLVTVTQTSGQVQCSSSGTGLPPGGTPVTITGATISFPSSSASSPAVVGVFTTSIIDAGSSPAAYSGPSLTFYSIAATGGVGYTLSPALTSSNYVAGSAALTYTVVLNSGQSGVPVVFSYGTAKTATLNNGNSNPGQTFSVASGVTGSGGSLATSAVPSDFAGDASTIVATLGTGSGISTNTGIITTIAGSPSTVVVTAGGSATKTDYITTLGTPGYVTSGNYAKVASGGITGAVSDAFGNTVSSSISGQSCTITGFGGSFDSAGTQASTNSPAIGASCSTGGVVATTLNYYQSGAFGTTSYVQVTMTGTYGGSSFTATGLSQTLSTSTFDSGTSAIPTTTSPLSITAGNAAGVVSIITLTYTLTNAQANVPVTFFGYNTTTPNAGFFAGGSGTSSHPAGSPGIGNEVPASVTATTTIGSSGTATATATYTIDPTVGSMFYFKAQVSAPITGAASNKLGLSGATGTFTTTAGAASKLLVKGFFTATLGSSTKYAVPGQTLYLNVVLADYWGNTVTNSGGQIQITLALSPSSAGALSATNVYIANSCPDTFGSACTGFGTITLAVSSSAALGALTISATGFYGGSGTITIVSASPTILVATPSNSATLNVVGHIIYSSLAGVGFSGTAAVSKGVYPAPTISNIYYTIDGGSSSSAGTSSPWSFVATLSNGLHTVTAWAKDSGGSLSATNSTIVLVDTAGPTITNPTTLGYGAGSPIVFTVVSPGGVLKSVSATVNGTALAASQVTITSGTNNPGTSVTYSVSVTGLLATTGHYGIALTAKDLAGNSKTGSTVVVQVTVQQAQSLVIQGTPTSGTVGNYKGVTVSYQNVWSSAQNVVVFAVWKNSLGQTVYISAASYNLASGATQTGIFLPEVGLASGTYTVSLFVWTTTNTSVSVTSTVTVTV